MSVLWVGDWRLGSEPPGQQTTPLPGALEVNPHKTFAQMKELYFPLPSTLEKAVHQLIAVLRVRKSGMSQLRGWGTNGEGTMNHSSTCLVFNAVIWYNVLLVLYPGGLWQLSAGGGEVGWDWAEAEAGGTEKPGPKAHCPFSRASDSFLLLVFSAYTYKT